MWTGAEITRLEHLTMASFIAHGHPFRLWVYEPPAGRIPAGVQLEDASDIIPADQVFRRESEDPDRKLGKGSLGLFSDLFRYKLLHMCGGIWVDMDMTCLKPFNFAEPYVFRTHRETALVGNIMKVPKGCPALRDAFEKCLAAVDRYTADWLLSNRILSDAICSAGLQRFIRSDLCNLDIWNEVWHFSTSPAEPDSRWYALHWCNELWRTHKLDKNAPQQGSLLHNLMHQFGV